MEISVWLIVGNFREIFCEVKQGEATEWYRLE